MKRPSRTDERVISAVAEQLSEEITDLDRDDILKALKNSFDLDGYALAKELDRMGYSIDANMVEQLDSASHLAWAAYDRIVAKWVQSEGIKPSLNIGDKVTAPVGTDTLEGEIIKVDERLARYTVNCPSRGHVKEGLGTHGFLIDYEKVEAR